jgi:hypothetical protein
VQQQQQPQRATTTIVDARSQNTVQQDRAEAGQSVQAFTVNTASVNNLLTDATVVQQNGQGLMMLHLKKNK